jgi:ribose/xylose/arabinose/galactoside ABC-type transport system permease subunit
VTGSPSSSRKSDTITIVSPTSSGGAENFAQTGVVASIQVNLGEGYIFTVFAAGVIGGVSLQGGCGTMLGAIGGGAAAFDDRSRPQSHCAFRCSG